MYIVKVWCAGKILDTITITDLNTITPILSNLKTQLMIGAISYQSCESKIVAQELCIDVLDDKQKLVKMYNL